MTLDALTPLSHHTDEELLKEVYLKRPTCTPLELELAQRLETEIDRNDAVERSARTETLRAQQMSDLATQVTRQQAEIDRLRAEVKRLHDVVGNYGGTD